MTARTREGSARAVCRLLDFTTRLVRLAKEEREGGGKYAEVVKECYAASGLRLLVFEEDTSYSMTCIV